jgi:flagellar motor switch protein FliG
MFVFDNLIDMDEKNLGTLMRTVDSAVLVVALKGVNDLLKAKIFSCMSARAAQAIADEIEERGPIRLAEVMDSQKLIIATARRMADAGTIMLGGKGNDFV